jgi:hypothetical protein
MTGLRAAALGLALLLVPAGAALGQAPPLERVTAVVHVHSDRSTGDNSYEQLAEEARRSGVDALLITEEQLLRVEYGLSPFRALTRVVHEERSVFVTGVERYFERIAEVRRRLGPAPLLIAGVEVLPHYRWVGFPFDGTLMLHDHQKNLHVFGLTDPHAIRMLPAIGNPHVRRWGWASLVDLAPALLVVPGVVLLVRPRVSRRRVGRAVVIVRRRHWVLGGVLLLVGLVSLVRGWPFTVDAYPWWVDARLEPQQDLIDAVDEAGGLTMWSFPEAFDEGRRKFGPLTVGWRTDPHGDDLLRTVRYTAFGALYAHTTRFVDPGRGWDRVLGEYAAGERSRPPWAMGEAGAHGIARGRDFGGIFTVFLVPERTEAAVLDALRRGRLYALQRTPEASLVLAEWSFGAGEGGPRAVSGDTVKVAEGTTVDVRVAVDVRGTVPGGVRVTLVRNGAVLDTWTGETGVRASHREVFDGRPLVFRIDARGRAPHRLIGSPIVVTRP